MTDITIHIVGLCPLFTDTDNGRSRGMFGALKASGHLLTVHFDEITNDPATGKPTQTRIFPVNQQVNQDFLGDVVLKADRPNPITFFSPGSTPPSPQDSVEDSAHILEVEALFGNGGAFTLDYSALKSRFYFNGGEIRTAEINRDWNGVPLPVEIHSPGRPTRGHLNFAEEVKVVIACNGGTLKIGNSDYILKSNGRYYIEFNNSCPDQMDCLDPRTKRVIDSNLVLTDLVLDPDLKSAGDPAAASRLGMFLPPPPPAPYPGTSNPGTCGGFRFSSVKSF